MCAMEAKYLTDTNGKRTAVVLPVEEYERLLEDLHDLVVVAERRDERSISFDEMRRRLKKNGKL